MLKKLLLSALALAFVLPVVAQHQRRVLIEEFTNASCGPCASQNPAFNATIAANEEYLTPIKYQTSWPGFDPMNQQTQAEVQPRVTYYGVTGVPNGRQNGTLEIFPMTTYSAAMIQAAYNTLTPVTMNLTHSLTADYDSILISLSVTSDVALIGNLRLRVAVLEEEIVFESAPGSNGEKDFYQIMRKMLPNSGGTITGDFAAGETKTYSFAWPLAYIYDLNQVGVSAWLQNDGTKEVYQSARSLPIGGIPYLPKVQSVNTFACAPGFSPSFTVANLALTPLTSATFRYRVGSSAWTDLAWTGDVAVGASTEVTLDTVISQAGTINVEVEVLNSNNGIPTNIVGNVISKIQYKTLFEAPTALPFDHGFQSGPVPPAGWTVNNVVTSAGTHGWKLATNAGAGSSRSTRCNMYDIGKGGKAYLTTPKLDLSAANGVTTLTFDHAYTYYNNADFDSLRVEVSNDCGETWTTVFHDGKNGLATAPAMTNAFTPDASQWRDNAIDISAFNGAELLLRFVGESGFGNNLYIDNINVTALVGVKELELNTFSIRPNPTSDVAQVFFGLEKAESIQLSVFNAQGALVQSRNLGDLPSGEHVVNLSANNLTSGTYRIVLQGKEGVANAQWMVVK